MRFWVDADARPRDAKDIVLRSAVRMEIEAVLMANQRVPLPANNRFALAVRAEGVPDRADDSIAENAARMEKVRNTGVDTGGPSPHGPGRSSCSRTRGIACLRGWYGRTLTIDRPAGFR